MADTSSSNKNPRGHPHVGAGRPRGRGRGGTAGKRSRYGADQDEEGVRASSVKGGDSGRGGLGWRREYGKRENEPGFGRSTGPVRPRGHANRIRGDGIGKPNNLNHFNYLKRSDMSAFELEEFLQRGLEIMAFSTDSKEMFVNNLATESGLTKIRQIVETEFSSSYSVSNPTFDCHCILFLQMITQDEIRYSLVLEKAVGTIYNVVYGHDGNRGVRFLEKISNCLVQIVSEGGNKNEPLEISRIEEALVLVTKALLSTLTLNQGAAIRTEFREIAARLSGCYRVDDINSGVASLNVRSAHENIRKIRDILSTGDAVSASSTANNRVTPTSRQHELQCRTFESEVDLPGELSKFGARHDNDHALISDIRILPTASEILYDERPDFLPIRQSLNSTSGHHETGILRLLDSQFRLLREDTSGSLRDSIRLVLDNWDVLIHGADWGTKHKILRNGSPTPIRIYFSVEIQQIKSDSIKGVEIELEFDQVRRAKNLKLQKRKEWWQKYRGLREGGTILALVDGEEKENMAVIFLLVSKREISVLNQSEQKDPASIGNIRDLASSAERAMVTLRLASPTCKSELSNLINLASNSGRPNKSLILLEFPAVLHNSFEGVLRSLQSLHKNPASIPLTTWLTPRVYNSTLAQESATIDNDRELAVPAPAYFSRNVTIDLSCLPRAANKNENGSSTPTPLTVSLYSDPHVLAAQISEETTLDTGQAVAMVSALRHEVALIQGPPGTGKSYVGIQIARCLLKNRDLLGLGPILCVCYTNHALDQFLHELINSGVTNILRIGSRSQFPELEELSLENYKKRQQIPRSRDLGKRINACRRNLTALSAEIQKVCRQATESNVEMVKGFLEKRFPVQMNGIFGSRSEAGMDGLNSESKHDAAMENWRSGDAPGDFNSDVERTIEQLLQVEIWALTRSERARLYEYWHQSAFTELSHQFYELMQHHSSVKEGYTSLFNSSDAQLLDQFHIVGVTTTGLANQSDLLRNLQAKILICEEAGEVLEAHVLTTLLPSIQHVILIGDHLQLRPRISNIELSMEYDRAGPTYNLDESLFERLANMKEKEREGEGKFPIVQLDHQRRMHPTISALIRETLYPRLQDHLDTTSYPQIPGIKRRLFWLDHRNMEDASDPGEPMQSKTNIWEVKTVTALVRHLCRQGKYKRGEIAVLTPYVGQLRLLRDELAQMAELIIGDLDLAELDTSDVEVSGKGNSGKKQQPSQQTTRRGNLLDELRIATVDNFQGEEATIVIVSLVRSNKQQNCGFLKTSNRINVLLSRAKHGMYIIGNASTSSRVPMWSSVISLLEKNGNIGRKLELHCSRHPNNKVYVSSHDDFNIHAPEGGCAEKCNLRLSCGHSCSFKCHSTTLHEAVKCMESCTKLRECDHPCSRKCGVPCGECPEMVSVVLPCGHGTADVECHQKGNLTGVKCRQPVVQKILGCGHSITKQCHETKNITGQNLGASNDESPCKTPCGRLFTTCSHACNQPCHPDAPCPPCDRACEVRCKHSKCPRKCSDPCPPCAELCGWKCNHRSDSCNMPCAVPCGIIPCNYRCEKKLAVCGHQCPGLCGERCPESRFCQLCCEQDIRKRIVDYIQFEEYGQVEIDKNPIIFLSCGHFYTVSTLDGIMELTQYYITDPTTDAIIRPKLFQREAASGSALKGCPECRGPLRDIDRYNRIVKKALLDEATRRFVTQAHSRCAELVEEIQDREMKIEDERREFILDWSQTTAALRDSDQVENSLKEYQAAGIRLQKRINKLIKSMEKTEQPFGRVNEMFASAVSKHRDIKGNTFELDESTIQTGFQLRGKCFSLRLNWAILWDFDKICSNNTVDSRIRLALRNAVADRIKGLISKCLLLVESSQNAKFPQQEVEAHIYHAMFSMLSLSNAQAQGHSANAATETARMHAKNSIEKCDALCSRYPGSLAYLKDDIEKARILVNGGTFYTFVTTEEKREVYRAMAGQFSGTGHWYYCRNNHPFTVGECGMPMEEARCPQCAEPIGGHDHAPVAGVSRAEDLELEFGNN